MQVQAHYLEWHFHCGPTHWNSQNTFVTVPICTHSKKRMFLELSLMFVLTFPCCTLHQLKQHKNKNYCFKVLFLHQLVKLQFTCMFVQVHILISSSMSPREHLLGWCRGRQHRLKTTIHTQSVHLVVDFSACCCCNQSGHMTPHPGSAGGFLL